jgi:hypothetical protein
MGWIARGKLHRGSTRCFSLERAVESAMGRRLLERGDRDNPWAVVSALFAAMFDDHTIEWLNRCGYLRWDQRGQGEAIIAAVNAVIERQR